MSKFAFQTIQTIFGMWVKTLHTISGPVLPTCLLERKQTAEADEATMKLILVTLVWTLFVSIWTFPTLGKIKSYRIFCL